MRVANVRGRAVVIVDGDHVVDVERASEGRFSSSIHSLFDQWEEFRAWASTVPSGDATPIDLSTLDAPAPSPRQVFAIGLNYSDHAAESGFDIPESPTVFTKFLTSIAGPFVDVTLPPGGNTDWEVELVVVMGAEASHVAEADAWSYVAGLTVGQDLSERITQRAGPVPQFSLGKSFPGFGPIGPWIVTVDEFVDPDAIEIGCAINGVEMQRGNTRDLVFSVPSLIAQLSAVVTLLPGDLIFTGTPSGVGLGRTPPVWLAPGDELVSWVEGIGEIRQVMVAG